MKAIVTWAVTDQHMCIEPAAAHIYTGNHPSTYSLAHLPTHTTPAQSCRAHSCVFILNLTCGCWLWQRAPHPRGLDVEVSPAKRCNAPESEEQSCHGRSQPWLPPRARVLLDRWPQASTDSLNAQPARHRSESRKQRKSHARASGQMCRRRTTSSREITDICTASSMP
jgi:hypothetical protein